jgi:hypothetical protein
VVIVIKYKRKSDSETVRTLRCSIRDFLDCNLDLEMSIENLTGNFLSSRKNMKKRMIYVG